MQKETLRKLLFTAGGTAGAILLLDRIPWPGDLVRERKTKEKQEEEKEDAVLTELRAVREELSGIQVYLENRQSPERRKEINERLEKLRKRSDEIRNDAAGQDTQETEEQKEGISAEEVIQKVEEKIREAAEGKKEGQKEKNPLSFGHVFTDNPKVKFSLPDISGFEYRIEHHEIPDEEIAKMIERSMGYVKEDKKAEYGDFLSLDYSASCNGILFDSSDMRNAPMTYILSEDDRAFSDPLIGIKKGESREFDYTESDSGRKFQYKVKARSVCRKQDPDEASIKRASYGECSTKEEYAEWIRKHIREQEEKDQKEQLRGELAQYIESRFESPYVIKDLFEEIREDNLKKQAADAEKHGMTKEEYAAHRNLSVEELSKEADSQAEYLTRMLMLWKAEAEAASLDLSKEPEWEEELLKEWGITREEFLKEESKKILTLNAYKNKALDLLLQKVMEESGEKRQWKKTTEKTTT